MYNPLDLIRSLKEVPAMPNVIKHALDVMKDPESSTKELARIISYDQSLSTKVLTLVNSAYYGFSQQVTSIGRAISLIGMLKAKNIILTVAMRPMLINQGDKELWKHSITAAVGSEFMAKYTKVMDPDDAFVIGFLHDLGKIVLNLKDPALYQRVKDAVSRGAKIVDAEQHYFGVDHCQMGSLLAKQWQLPLMINNVIKYHHSPNASSMPVQCSLVYLVDSLIQENFVLENLDQNFIRNLYVQIEQPDILRENIFSQAALLLNELSN